MLGKNVRSRRCSKKVDWSSINFEDGSHLQRIAMIRWRADWFEWKIFPGAKALNLLHEIQTDLQGKHVTPENFCDRIIFMSMFNDIVLEKKENEDSCALTSRKIKEYASIFNDGHWAFLGPVEESKWYQGYATDCGKWDLRASQVVEDFENSRHPVFQGMSPLGRGVLKKKNNRDTIHYNGEYCNIDLL